MSKNNYEIVPIAGKLFYFVAICSIVVITGIIVFEYILEKKLPDGIVFLDMVLVISIVIFVKGGKFKGGGVEYEVGVVQQSASREDNNGKQNSEEEKARIAKEIEDEIKEKMKEIERSKQSDIKRTEEEKKKLQEEVGKSTMKIEKIKNEKDNLQNTLNKYIRRNVELGSGLNVLRKIYQDLKIKYFKAFLVPSTIKLLSWLCNYSKPISENDFHREAVSFGVLNYGTTKDVLISELLIEKVDNFYYIATPYAKKIIDKLLL